MSKVNLHPLSHSRHSKSCRKLCASGGTAGIVAAASDEWLNMIESEMKMNSESIRNGAATAGLAKNRVCFTSLASISMRASSTADCKRKRSSKQSLGREKERERERDRTWLTWCDLTGFYNDLFVCNPTLKHPKKWFGWGCTFKGCLIWGGWDYFVCLDMGVEQRKFVKCKSFFPIDLVPCAALCCTFRGHCQASTWGPSFDLKTPSAGTAVVHPS